MTSLLWQPALDDAYTTLPDDELARRIEVRKRELGSDLVVLGHHYQQDEVIRFADYTGDSFKLSQLAAQRVRETGAKYVIFCGVHFMAETADILTEEDVQVILPDLGAGCTMADMAQDEEVIQAWEDLHAMIEEAAAMGDVEGRVRVIPICYMNSSAAIKAFCGEHGGAVCTSSNCDKVFEWALAGGETTKAEDETIKILFMPDEHLGRNTAAAVGFDPQTQMCVYDPRHPDGLGGLEPQDVARSTFILWKGHCSVHKLFRAEHVDQIREQWPDVNVMVHPECVYEVCQKADRIGSTEGILNTVRAAEKGSRWAIGTEVHMVNRLANEMKPKGVTVRILSDCQCLCTTMYRIDMPHLLSALDKLAAGEVVNQISVPKATQHFALIALNRMLAITGKGNVHRSE